MDFIPIFFAILFFLITLGVPIVIVIFRRNFKTLAICFIVPCLYVFLQNYIWCHSSPGSEFCTWGYLNYLAALMLGCGLYLATSLVSGIVTHVKAKPKPKI